MVTRTATIQMPRVCHFHHRGTKDSMGCLARDYGLPRQECSVDPGLGLCRSPPREATTPTSRCDISSVHKNLRVSPGQFSNSPPILGTPYSTRHRDNKASPELENTRGPKRAHRESPVRPIRLTREPRSRSTQHASGTPSSLSASA